MSRFAKLRCVVRNCNNMAGLQLCSQCFHMLRTGKLDMKSSAWFVSELLFVEQQNEEVMRQLYDKMNHDGK